MTIFTIGHGARSLDELLQILRDSRIDVLVDVRSYPRSRTNPQVGGLSRTSPKPPCQNANQAHADAPMQFNRAQLEEQLTAAPSYLHAADLGGRRRRSPAADKHVALRVDAFRNYAGHMDLPEFGPRWSGLVEMAAGRRVCVMCNETLWWRCQWRLIADALVARGLAVEHLGVGARPAGHQLWSIAQVLPDGGLVYDN